MADDPRWRPTAGRPTASRTGSRSRTRPPETPSPPSGRDTLGFHPLAVADAENFGSGPRSTPRTTTLMMSWGWTHAVGDEQVPRIRERSLDKGRDQGNRPGCSRVRPGGPNATVEASGNQRIGGGSFDV